MFAAVRHFLDNYMSGAEGGALTVPKSAVWGYTMGESKLIVTEMGERGEKDVFVADIDLSDVPYFIDNTGKSDVTDVINGALSEMAARGGGTVFLPAGRYLISDTLQLSPYVTLRGEYVDPDKGDFSKGTVLILAGKSKFKSKSAVGMAASSTVPLTLSMVIIPLGRGPLVRPSQLLISVQSRTSQAVAAAPPMV